MGVPHAVGLLSMNGRGFGFGAFPLVVQRVVVGLTVSSRTHYSTFAFGDTSWT